LYPHEAEVTEATAGPPVTVRPMRLGDVERVIDLGSTALGGAYAAVGTTIPPLDAAARDDQRTRLRGLLAAEPAGCHVAERAGDGADPSVVGVAMALRREGLWFLALLAVDPMVQATGVGARLLAAAETTAVDATAGMLMSSVDPRALRRYWAAGFALEPTFSASGPVDRALLAATPGIRDGDVDRDGDLVADLDLQQRGYPHGPDIGRAVELGSQLLVLDDGPARGYAVAGKQGLWALAATDPPAAVRLLHAALAQAEGEQPVRVGWLSARVPWALDTCLRTRLSVSAASGALATRGELGPMTSYLPNGARG